MDPVSLLVTVALVGLSYTAQMLLRPHAQRPPMRAMTSAWGDTIPIIYNNMRVAGKVIQAGDVTVHDAKKKGGPASYFQTFAIGFCEGQRQFGRIWMDGQVEYDPRTITAPPAWQANTTYGAGDIVLPTAGGTVQLTASTNGTSGGSEPTWDLTTNAVTRDNTVAWIASPYVARRFIGKAYNFTMRLYEGDEDQLPDAALEEIVGTGRQPAYRGLCYAVFENFDLSKYGNRIPNIEAEFTAATVPESFIPLLIDTGGSPTFDETDAYGIAPDFANNRIYSYGPMTGASADQYIFVHNATSGAFVSKASVASICVLSANTFVANPSFALGADGFLYALTTTGTTGAARKAAARVSKINKSTMQEVGSYQPYAVSPGGYFGPFTFDFILLPFAMGGTNYLVLLLEGWGGPVEIINADTMTQVPNAFLDFSQNDSAGNLVVGEQPDSHTQNFYWMAEEPAGIQTQIAFVKIVFDSTALTPLTSSTFKLLNATEIDAALTDIGVDIDPASLMFESSGNNLVFLVLNDDAGGTRVGWVYIVKIDSTAGAVQWATHVSTGIFSQLEMQYGVSASIADLSAGTLTLVDVQTGGNGYFTIDLSTGTITTSGTSVNVDNGCIEASAWFGARNQLLFYYRGSNNVTASFPGGWALWTPGQGAVMTLEDIVADVSGRVGLDASDYDYSALASVVPRGAIIQQRDAARAFLDPLSLAFFFDLVDIGEKIIGSLRSTATSIVTIPESDLAASDSPETIVDKISTVRGMDIEIPRDISVNYYDIDHDYQQGSLQAKRGKVVQTSSGRNSIQYPVAMKPGEAADRAARALHLLWMERSKKKLFVPLDYIKVTACDIITAIRDSRSHQLRATKATLDPAKLIISIEGVSEDTGIYSISGAPNLSDLIGGTFQGGTIIPVLKPVLAVMDTATLRFQDISEPGVYLAGCVSDPDAKWTGETVEESQDNSVFDIVAQIELQATIGTAQNVLNGWTRWTVWDNTNHLDVKMKNGALGNASAADVVNNLTNAFWMSNGEIIQATTATLIATASDGDTYRLSGLLRGRFGTESFIGTATGSETVVYLDASVMQNATYSPSEIGATRYWKGVNESADGLDSGTQTLVMATRRLLPFAPYFLRGSRDGSNNLTITGLRRMRWRGRPLWTPPETDTPVTMEIEILDTASPPNVKRTLTATLTGSGSGITDASGFTAYYSAADQVTDFGSVQSSLAIEAYELNAIIGRGYGGRGTV